MPEKVWNEFVKWSHKMATGRARNSYGSPWPDFSVVTTKTLLTMYPPAKDERVRAALLERAKTETCGMHCVNNANL